MASRSMLVRYGRDVMLYSLRSRLVITFTLLFIVPFVIMVVFFTRVSDDVIGGSIEASTSQTMDQYAAFVDTLTMQVDDVANQVLSNDLTQQWIATRINERLLPEQQLMLDAEVRKFLSSIALNHSVVTSITIFDEHGTAVGIRDQVFRDPSYLESEWYQAFIQEERRWVLAHQDPYQPTYLQDKSVMSLIFPLQQLSTFKNVGVLKVNFLTSLIEDPLDKIHFGQTGRVYLLDWSELQRESLTSQAEHNSLLELVADSRSTGMIRVDKTDEAHLLFFRKLKTQNWILIGEVPEYELYHTLTDTRRTMLGVSGILLCLTIAVAFWLSSGIARPLTQLARAMRYVERGDFNSAHNLMLSTKRVKRDEVGFVGDVFRNMLRRLRYLIETEFQANLRQRDAEYKALFMQINPHFLYNTLEVISSLVAQGRNDEVIDVTESLGSMLRYSLKLDSDLVKLSEEIRCIRHYITILNIRFGERLTINIEEDERTKHVHIVKFILQPLLENAVKFSLEHVDVAKIAIITNDVDGNLEITVQDNGIGMSEQLVAEMIEEPRDDNRHPVVLGTEGKQVGLRNIIARCRLYYGDNFEVKINSTPHVGTEITLRMPYGERELSV